MTLLPTRERRRNTRKPSKAFRPRHDLENLEARIVLSYADLNGAVVLSVAEANNGSALVITFDGPLDPSPSNAVQSPTNVGNYSVEVPSGNAEVITSSLASVAISSAGYNGSANQVTLTLGTPLAQGQSYRLFVNGVADSENAQSAGLIDGKNNPIDGDYDDTASGDFYGLFAWTTAGKPINFFDSQGDAVTLSLSGPGQMSAWRELDGDFDAGDLTAQANLATGINVQQLSVANGVAGATTLSGSATFAAGSDGVIVIPPTIPGTFTSALPSYFQPTAPVPTPPTPVVANANNLPFTIQIQPVNLPNLPAINSADTALDNVSGSPFQGDWLLFGGRTNGLHTFTNPNDNFPPQDQNEAIYVVNPTTGQVWSESWSATDVTAGWLASLYSTNQQYYQDGDTLYTAGGYGAVDQGGNSFADYTTYDTLTALSVNGLVTAVVNNGDVAALSQIQQIHGQAFKITGGEMAMLNGLTYLVVGQDFEGEYGGTDFTQTYSDLIQAFNINYNGQVPNSLSVSNYQAQNDQVNFRRRDYNLGDVVLPNGQQALEIFGGVFTPGPGTLASQGTGYRDGILIRDIGDTQVLPYQQAFNQYTSPHIGLFDASTGSMDTIFLGGIGLYSVSFATGQLTLPLLNAPPYVTFLPFVNAVTTQVEQANGTTQEFEMPSQLSSLSGSAARFFATPGLPTSGQGVLNLDELLGQPTTLGYMYGGIVSTVGLTASQATQTMATNAVYQIVLVPNGGGATSSTFVNSLYQVLLGRLPLPSEQNYWVSWLNAGQSTTHVALAFIQSTEHRTAELSYYFNEYLNAQLDPGSDQYYLNEFAHGATQQQVIAQILNSPQFALVASFGGPTSNAATVGSIYTDLLNRGPTASEETSGTNLLNSGSPALPLINSIMTSNEYLTDEVNADYTIYLGNSPTPAQEQRGVNLLRRESSERFVASLLGSRGYFDNHPGASGRKNGAVTPSAATAVKAHAFARPRRARP